MDDRYTFGDNDEASRRLKRLAELYEPATRELLLRCGRDRCGVAVDLGCGAGWSTRLLRETLSPSRTLGLDASPRFVDEARRRHGGALEFAEHDVTRPLPLRADLLLCRFLLTHLRDVDGALAVWADAALPGGRLLVLEVDSLSAEHPALSRYYALVAQLQRHYGQALEVGPRLEAAFARSPWRVVDSRRIALAIPAAQMAELHLANLRTWRSDEHALRAFDPAELDGLERTLARIVAGDESAGTVSNGVRQIVAELGPTSSRANPDGDALAPLTPAA
jgi:SAM-dependent methyltransferase